MRCLQLDEAAPLTQRAPIPPNQEYTLNHKKHPFIKEYTLNHKRDPNMIQGMLLNYGEMGSSGRHPTTLNPNSL